MTDNEKQTVLETFKNLPREVQMAMIAGKALAETERPKQEDPK